MFNVNERVYHYIFGWCKVLTPVNSAGDCLVDLEAQQVSYYVMGKGTHTAKRNEQGANVILTPAEELVKDDQVKLTSKQSLKVSCHNPTIIK